MKLLITLSRVPYPLDKGDKLRAYYFIKYLSKYFDIVLFCVSSSKIHPETKEKLGVYCTEVHIYRLSKFFLIINLIKAFLKGLPLQVGYFYNKRAKNSLESFIRRHNPDYILCQLVRMAEYVKDVNLPKMLDYQDAFSYGLKRRIEKSDFFSKLILRIEFNRMLKYEHNVFDLFDKKIIISDTDRMLIPHDLRKQIFIISNGVDTDYYKPTNITKEFDIMFSGNMSYPPNIDAVLFLVNEILPIVNKDKKDIRVLIAGTSPADAIKKLNSNNIKVTGWVDDMRLCYSKSKIFIAPMRLGIGLQNKLLEAMAMGLPCITTSLANNALKATENKEILVGNSKNELAEALLKLLNDTEFRNYLSENSIKFVKENYSWEKNIEDLAKIIENKNCNEKN
jgi:sugar transferase (PEP-CTERM/EpsH1 system associated)